MERCYGYSRILATGAPVPYATIAVRDGDGVLIPLFSDDLATPTPLANPFLADANGYFFFYAAAGSYSIQFSGGIPPVTIAVPYTWGDVPLDVASWSPDNFFVGNYRELLQPVDRAIVLGSVGNASSPNPQVAFDMVQEDPGNGITFAEVAGWLAVAGVVDPDGKLCSIRFARGGTSDEGFITFRTKKGGVPGRTEGLRITRDGRAAIQAGTEAIPGLGFILDAGTGIYQGVLNQLDVSVDTARLVNLTRAMGLSLFTGTIAGVWGADNGANTRTNNTTKVARFASAPYENAEEPIAFVVAINDGTNNDIAIGGGSGTLNAATLVRIFTAAGVAITTGVERVRVTNVGNMGVGTPTPGGSGTVGDKVVSIGVGTNAPVGGVAGQTSLYSALVAGSAELFALDAAGNATQLSPHNFDIVDAPEPEDGHAATEFPWSYAARNAFLGVELGVDLAGLVTAVEKLTGQRFAHLRPLPPEQQLDWVAQVEQRFQQDQADRAAWVAARAAYTPTLDQPTFQVPAPTPVADATPPPAWLARLLQRRKRGVDDARLARLARHIAAWRAQIAVDDAAYGTADQAAEAAAVPQRAARAAEAADRAAVAEALLRRVEAAEAAEAARVQAELRRRTDRAGRVDRADRTTRRDADDDPPTDPSAT